MHNPDTYVGFSGHCTVLRPGTYPSLQAMGLNDRISSVRTIHATVRYDDARYAASAASSTTCRRARRPGRR